MNMITVKDVQSQLGVSYSTACKVVNNNGFPKVKIGRRILIPQEEFEKYIKKHVGTTIII